MPHDFALPEFEPPALLRRLLLMPLLIFRAFMIILLLRMAGLACCRCKHTDIATCRRHV